VELQTVKHMSYFVFVFSLNGFYDMEQVHVFMNVLVDKTL